MKLGPITLSTRCTQRIGHEIATQICGVGEMSLLAQPLIGLVASRECPGHVLLETLGRVPDWVKAGCVIISGFHSPLEQQVLRSLLRRQGRTVKVLARGMAHYRPLPEEREPLAARRMLVISAYPSTITRTTRATALERNRLVLTLAAEVCVPYVAADSPLAALLAELSPVVWSAT
jgi:predicted Rossmann fold nucleotide-binding protein DprA/Smf involved in DNA uptake